MIFKCYWNDATKTTTNIHFIANVVVLSLKTKKNATFLVDLHGLECGGFFVNCTMSGF